MAESEPPSTGGCSKPLMIVSCAVTLLFLASGILVGQSAGMLPQLMENNSFIQITKEEATWIASINACGMFIGSCVSATLSDTLGRMRLSQIACLCLTVGYGIMTGANSSMLIIAGRLLAGIGIGCNNSASIYISEVAPPAYRGILLSACPLLSSVGIVYIYIFGGYLPWKVGAVTACLISTFALVLMLLCYDSPVWLVRKNRINDARKSLKSIEGLSNVQARLKELRKVTMSQPETKFRLGVFMEPTVWKPFAMILAISVLQNTAGFYIVLSYTVQFMKEFRSTYDPLKITIAVGMARLLAMVLASYLLKIIRRKTLGAVSGFSSFGSLLLVYGYLKLEDTVPLLHGNSWIPIGLFLIYLLTMGTGMFPLPWILAFEVFPIDVRGMMCGVSYCIMFLVQFVGVKAYYILLDNLQLEGMILMFAASSLLFGLFSVTILVETHNKTLGEIGAVFANQKQKDGKNEFEGQNTLFEIPTQDKFNVLEKHKLLKMGT